VNILGMKRVLSKAVLFALLAPFLLQSTGNCEFYQYESDGGTISFTDNPARIPKKYKKKKKSRHDDDETSISVTRVRIKGNRVLVPVTINYRGREVRANFVLDTGAEVSTISPALAERLNIDPKDTRVAFAQGIGSAVHATPSVKLDYVLVGPNRKYDVDFIVISAAGQDGLLGMNFLRELRFHVNFDTSTIKWGD
jgi:predicted aspartyl protease